MPLAIKFSSTTRSGTRCVWNKGTGPWHVTLKPGVLDPQGKAIHHALEGLGFAGVQDVRVGKLIEIEADSAVNEAAVEEMCRKLLANTVIENFRIDAA